MRSCTKSNIRPVLHGRGDVTMANTRRHKTVTDRHGCLAFKASIDKRGLLLSLESTNQWQQKQKRRRIHQMFDVLLTCSNDDQTFANGWLCGSQGDLSSRLASSHIAFIGLNCRMPINYISLASFAGGLSAFVLDRRLRAAIVRI